MKEKLINKLVAGALVFASVLPLAGSMPVHAAETQTKARWVLDGGKWYYYDDNWEKINGFWYHFDKDGVMEKNTTIKDKVGNDCVLNADGVLTNREEPQFPDDVYTGEE